MRPLLLVFALALHVVPGPARPPRKAASPTTRPAMKNIVIDRFTVPATAVTEFLPRLKRAGQQLRTQPGLMRYTAYETMLADGSRVFVTVAEWASEQAIEHAKAAMRAAQQQPGADPAELYARLHITLERGLYATAELP